VLPRNDFRSFDVQNSTLGFNYGRFAAIAFCARDWRGSQIRDADLLLEFAAQNSMIKPHSGLIQPRKARFFAKQKMRPDILYYYRIVFIEDNRDMKAGDGFGCYLKRWPVEGMLVADTAF
jgi:hypothetical protein